MLNKKGCFIQRRINNDFCVLMKQPLCFLGDIELNRMFKLFDKLEFDNLKDTFVIFNHGMKTYYKSENNANN